ncbi:hypothetical protein E2F46_14455 [Luteimonas aestuarii]|uniref:Uncharacterized protein n=1 Tax=Luteimonas aestuarii TaxID=453837 RepID=A0A4R5TJF3_9GAMM|nr:hypothetical protein [Luteimonas aestuarii]TDK21739.1 hypothetical protein E2F46_14455 [Luteimonas aestuarii]
MIAWITLCCMTNGRASGPVDGSLDAFSTLFASTCMQHYDSQDALTAAITAYGGQDVPAGNASFFLGGKGGAAWIILAEEGRFVVSLREDGTCAVFAQRAIAEAARAGFQSLVSTAHPPLLAEPRTMPTAVDEQSRTLACAWFRPEDDSELLFVLTTSDDPDANVQAVATVSIASRDR